MSVVSKEQMIEAMESRSVILSKEQPAPGMPPMMSSTRFFDETGLRQYFNDLTRQDNDFVGFPIGLIRQAEAEVKQADRNWKDFDSRQVPPRGKPEGRFLEDLNRAEARLEIYQREAQVIKGVLDEADEKREANERRLRESSERREKRRRNV